MIIREFFLADKRDTNKQFNLNIANSAYLTKPSGLGYELETSYSRVGTHFVANYIRDRQLPINGSIVNVADDPYVALQPLMDFIRNLKNPVLVYKTTAGVFFKDVDITAFGKSEMEKKSLICPITFIPKSLWYQNISGEDIYEFAEDNKDDTKTYNYTYPYSYGMGNQRIIKILNDGSVEAQFKIDFYGVTANPEIAVVQDGIEINRVSIPCDIRENEVLHYSAIDGELSVYIEGEKITNLIGRLSIGEGKANFFGLPIGESYMYITASGNLTDKVNVNIQRYYRAV